MTTLILGLIVVYLLKTIVFKGARHQTSKTATVVSAVADPMDYGPYGMPTFLRKEGAEATRVRRDLAEFRKELDTVQDGDWIDRLIRRQIAEQGPT